jgi:cytochrome d ubiquinol oxidase subunit I
MLAIGLSLVFALVPGEEGPRQTLIIARLQTALSMAWHIVIACFGVGMPPLLLLAERSARRGDALAAQLSARWTHAFAVLFAVGAVSGTTLAFTLGVLWPGLFERFGDAFGIPFVFESLAFFTEAIAVGFWIYGRGRIPPRWHMLAGVVIAVSGLASAVFVVCANGWMNTPQGFTFSDGRVQDVDALAILMNPAALPEVLHMVLAALLVTGFALAGAHAFALLRHGESALHRRGLRLALGFSAVALPFQLAAGDFAARFIAKEEPVKFAAAEALFRTQAHAPLAIGGVVRDGELKGAFEIPGALSFLAHGDAAAIVDGLDQIPSTERPPVGAVHLAFQGMLAAAAFLTLIVAAHAWRLWRRREAKSFALGLIVCASPAAIVALECGWLVTELGRQPWVIHGWLRTSSAVTSATGLLPGLLIVLLVFALLSAAFVHTIHTLTRAEVRP